MLFFFPASLPLLGQLCNAFGRRYTMLSVIAVFILGSGICGGASSGGMLIAGRAVQGVGSGGIIMASSIIISDLVPLRQRGNYSAAIVAIIGIGSALGPIIGGAIVSSTTWRWVFYLNLPIGGVAFATLFVFLRVGYNKEMTFWQKIKRIDLVGNAVLVASTVSILYALSYAGTRYRWQSWHTLVPLFIGFFGLFVFACSQTIRPPTEPLMPKRFFQASTSSILAVNTFVYSELLYWCIFFLPVFFQGIKLYSPTRSGAALLPAFQAFIHERDMAVCTAAWYFIRPFGHIWGVAIPAAIFNSRIDSLIAQGVISDPRVAQAISAGGAYQSASAAFVKRYSPSLQTEIRAIHRESTRRVFQISLVFSGIAFLLSLLEKEIELRKTVETEFGLEQQGKDQKKASGQAEVAR